MTLGFLSGSRNFIMLFSGSPGKFLFYMGRIVTTALPNLVPQRRVNVRSEVGGDQFSLPKTSTILRFYVSFTFIHTAATHAVRWLRNNQWHMVWCWFHGVGPADFWVPFPGPPFAGSPSAGPPSEAAGVSQYNPREAQSRTLGGLWPWTAATFPREDTQRKNKFGNLGGRRGKHSIIWASILKHSRFLQFYNSRIPQF